MTLDELALRRAMNSRRLAGAKRRGPPDGEPGSPGTIADDLRRVKSMVEEVMAEALMLGDDDLIAGVGGLILYTSEVIATAERATEGGEE